MSNKLAAKNKGGIKGGNQKNLRMKPTKVKYTIDCTSPVEDNILDIGGLVQFFTEKIKVNGKTGNLGEKISVSRLDKNKISVVVSPPFSKRYIKYLIKKYLRKHSLRDFLRVIATKQLVYELRYFQMASEEAVEE